MNLRQFIKEKPKHPFTVIRNGAKYTALDIPEEFYVYEVDYSELIITAEGVMWVIYL